MFVKSSIWLAFIDVLGTPSLLSNTIKTARIRKTNKSESELPISMLHAHIVEPAFAVYSNLFLLHSIQTSAVAPSKKSFITTTN